MARLGLKGRLAVAAIVPLATVGLGASSPAQAATGSVSGVLVDAATGVPIPGGCAEVLTGPTGDAFAASCAGPDGHWTAVGDIPTGTWVLRSYDLTGAHATDSQALPFTDGQPLSGLRIALQPTAVMTGRVVDAQTGAPIVGACPFAYVARTTQFPYYQHTDCSDANGNWQLTGLPAGALTVTLSGDATHVGRWAQRSDTQAGATVFTTASGKTTRTGTLREHHGATLTGRITDRAGRPVTDAWIVIGDDHTFRFGAGGGDYSTQTDADGRYTITNIAPQKHSVLVESSDTSGLAWQWSGRASDPVNAKQLTFAYEETTTFNAKLGPEAVLAVTADPSTVGTLFVDAQTPSGAFVGYHSLTNTAWGATLVHGLPPGPVTVQSLTDANLTFWYDKALTRATATLITVTAGKTTTITLGAP